MTRIRDFEVIEDNGGGLTLAVFNENGLVEYLHTGYEYSPGNLLDDLRALKSGDNPVEEWDGNEDDPQGIYDDLISDIPCGCQIVADSKQIYPDRMGFAACKEFGIAK